MKCAVHPDVDATGYCRDCGKAMCPGCTREVNGALYCEQCLAAKVAAPPALSPAGPSSSNPGLAATLGFIPGLGAVYNGEYVKALIHVLVFAGLIAMMASDVSGSTRAFAIAAFVAFCCYMPVDAYRVAKARRLGQPDPSVLPEPASGRPVGAIVLIVIGVLFLLRNFDLFDMEWFSRIWPLGLVALGSYLVWSRMRSTS